MKKEILTSKVQGLNDEIKCIEKRKYIKDNGKRLIRNTILCLIGVMFGGTISLLFNLISTCLAAANLALVSYVSLKILRKLDDQANSYISYVNYLDKKEHESEQDDVDDQEEFYSKRYIEYLKKTETTNNSLKERYVDSLNKQSYLDAENNDFTLSKKDLFLDKEETKRRINVEINVYDKVFDLPALEISEEEWNVFFDTTYDFFMKNQIQDIYYSMMAKVERFTFAQALLDKKEMINIYDFIENLSYVENKNLSCEEYSMNDTLLESKDILALKKEIRSKLSDPQKTDFRSHVADFCKNVVKVKKK